MSLPKEFLRPVEIQVDIGMGWDDYSPDGSPWNAWFHRFVDGMKDRKQTAMAVVERMDGEIVLLPLPMYTLRFMDRDHQAN